MINAKPTVQFIHGLWHTPTHFEKVRKIFEDAGYPTSCQLHPSIESRPALGLADDAECIRNALSKLIEEEEKDVIVVAHSYGGMVASEGVEARFAKEKRQQEGQKGGVLHLVYMTAFLLPVGKGIVDAFGGLLPPGLLEIHEEYLCMMSNSAYRFYHDVPEQEQQQALGEMRLSPTDLNYTPQTKTNYLYHPVTYFYCENDQGVLYPIQQKMVQDAQDSGLQIRIERCAASHSPFLSMPYRVLEMVQSLDATDNQQSQSML